jgi:site-specific DNA-methyltransferase (adenine-specific)
MPEPYYADDQVTIYHGDALDILPTLMASSVDLVVTDPPYFQPASHYVPARGVAPVRSLGDTSVLLYAYKAWSDAIGRVAPGSPIYLFCDGQSYPVTFQAFYGLGRVRPLIWDKVTSFNGFTWRHQHELVAWVEPEGCPRVPTGDGDILRYRAVPVAQRLHPAEKPIALVARLIAKHSGAVLDPFCGSGTTLVAARDLGRRSVGIEIEERYCEIAAQRCAQEILNRTTVV